MKRRIRQVISIAVILLIVVGLYLWATEKERVSNDFAENLFAYPLPAQTNVMDKNVFYGYSFDHLLGSGGYMPVVASMNLTTSLSKEEITEFYKDVALFPYPRGNSNGVKLELYFENGYDLRTTREGYYYVKTDKNQEAAGIELENEEINHELRYVLQISCSFDYFLNIN